MIRSPRDQEPAPARRVPYAAADREPDTAPRWDAARHTLHAEWTKIRTAAGPFWLLAATVALTVSASAVTVAAATCPSGTACPIDAARLSLTGVQLGQAVVAMLAVLAICTEYSTGMIRTTLTATPRRSTVLAAKAVIVTALVLAAATMAVLGSFLAGRLILPGHRFTEARGYSLLSLGDGAVLRAFAGSVLYLALIALFSLGIAAIIRDSAVAIGTVLGLLYTAPILASTLASDPVWQRRIERYAPMNAGLSIQTTVGVHSLPITPWGGLGVLAAWATAALMGGGLAFRLRDA